MFYKKYDHVTVYQPEFEHEMYSDTLFNFQTYDVWSGSLERVLNFRIDPELKKAWVIALRSGLYTQGTGALATKDASGTICYCCLGVLCSLKRIERQWVPFDTVGDYMKGAFIFETSCHSEVGTPDGKWMADLGMEGRNADFAFVVELFGTKYIVCDTLADLNDGGFTFNQIADIIEYFF